MENYFQSWITTASGVTGDSEQSLLGNLTNWDRGTALGLTFVLPVTTVIILAQTQQQLPDAVSLKHYITQLVWRLQLFTGLGASNWILHQSKRTYETTSVPKHNTQHIYVSESSWKLGGTTYMIKGASSGWVQPCLSDRFLFIRAFMPEWLLVFWHGSTCCLFN